MVVCDGIASESVVARYFDPKLGRFLTQDSFLGSHDNPPSLHRYLYANANPTRFVDPTGFTAEGAELQGVLRETKDYFIDQAQGEGVVGFFKGVAFGLLAGATGLVESGVGLIDESATVAYAAPGIDLMGDPTGVESREELKKQVADVKETYYTLKEEGLGNALGRMARGATDTIIAAAKGDPRAIAQVTSAVTEIAAPGTVLKGTGALRAARKGGRELLESAGRGIRRGLDEATDRLPLQWSPNPGANLGNLRRRTPTRSAPKSIEYNVAPHGQQPRPSSPYASHHGVEKGYLSRNVPGYDERADPTIMLEDLAGGPHRRITGRQATERAGYRRATGSRQGGGYSSRRAQAIEQMQAQGVPEAKIAEWLLEHEGYMFEIGVPWQ